MRFVAFLSFLLLPLITVARAQVSPEGQACLDCHSSSTPGIVEQWRESAHAKKNVTAIRAIVPVRKIPQHLNTTAIASP